MQKVKTILSGAEKPARPMGGCLAFVAVLMSVVCANVGEAIAKDNDIGPRDNIGGKITDAITGGPVEDALVLVFNKDTTDGDRDSTDKDGLYSVYFTESFYVLVVAKDYDSLSAGIFPAPPPMRPKPRNFELMPKASEKAAIDGTVTDSVTSDGIDGAMVVLIARRSIRGGIEPGIAVDTTYTSANGGYKFYDLRPGDYRVRASRVGYRTKRTPAYTLTAGEIETVDVALAPAFGTVEGTVTDASSSEVLKEALVVLTAAGNVFAPESTITDIVGEYSFSDVPAGSGYSISISKANFYEDVTGSLTVPVDDTLVHDVVLTPYTAEVNGTVTDAQSSDPLVGAHVVLELWQASAWQPLDSMASSGTGGFSFSPLPAAKYRVQVTMDGYEPDSSDALTVSDDQTVTADIAMTAIANGTLNVFVGTSGETPPAGAVADAMVYAVLQPTAGGYLPEQDTLSGFTDTEGWITFPDVIAGTYTVRAYAGAFQPD
ncbi:MAG: hypothetical protein GF331_10295, partial [Chitinivibrionales bacterium]|nr:hypothetical protein [Chitinivibrionales bacterium]